MTMLQAAGPQLQPLLSIAPQDQTRAQPQTLDFIKQVGPTSVAAGIQGSDLINTPMDL